MTKRTFYLYVETGYADKANELRDFIRDNCTTFSTIMYDSETKVFIDKNYNIKVMPTDFEINKMVKLIADHFNLDVDGYILEQDFDADDEAVGHIIDGVVCWTSIDEFRFDWPCYGELKQALQKARAVRKPHIEWL